MITAEAAQILGISARRVRALIATGKLAATKAGRDWNISRDSVRLRMEAKQK